MTKNSTDLTTSDLKTTVFRIIMLDGNRRDEFRLVCSPGKFRVERFSKNDLDEVAWISALDNYFVVSLIGRLIALRAASGVALRLSANSESITEIDLGTINLSPDLVPNEDAGLTP